jgi:multidrug efflux pump subunit AcrB
MAGTGAGAGNVAGAAEGGGYGTGDAPGNAGQDTEAEPGSGEQTGSSLADARQRVSEALQRSRERIAAARRLREYIATGDIQNRIANIIRTLREAAEVLDGGTFSSLAAAISKVVAAGAEVRSLIDGLSEMDLSGELAAPLDNVRTALGTVSGYADRLPDLLTMVEGAFSQLTQGQLDAALGFSTAGRQLSDAQTQLATATTQYETARTAALKNANLDALVSASTLSGLIYAQNFSMPAGYIDDAEDNSWLLKIGDEYQNYADISDSLLADIDDIGTIRLSDVANITVIDNADKSYTRLNGEPAIVFSVFKSSATGTNEVSRNVWEAIDQLEKENEGLRFVNLMDQGEYITLIISDILKSMGLGALLAIFVLALFLWDIRPTIMVGISIPLSVVFTILLMYFTGLSLNIMTLSGLSLGIGMLVDNSIVVMENIIRLRQRGLSPARASVQGTKQVSGAIIASTLTTVSVFLPMMFTSGTVRELLVPMSLSISYCLMASLIVAMTVIPASASTLFRRVRPKKAGIFDKVLDVYGEFLTGCLQHKLLTIAVAMVLLVICIVRLVTMGIVVLPDITSDDIQVTIVTPEGESREESYKDAEEVMEVIMGIEGVRTVGIMDQGSTVSFVTSAGGASDSYGTYMCFVEPEEDATSSEIRRLGERVSEATEGMKAKVTVSSGGMSDMTALMSSGLSIDIKGHDMDTLKEIGQKVIDILEPVEGLENVSDGSENDDKALHLVIDKDKAMSYGLTVAQIYSAVSSRMTTDVRSTTITQDGVIMDVNITDNTDPLTRENVLDIEFDTSGSAASAASAAMGGMGSTGSMGSMGSMASMASMGAGGDLSSMAEAFMGSSGGGSGTGGLASLFGAGASDSQDTKEGELLEGAAGDSEGQGSSEAEDDGIHKLSEFAHLEETTSPSMINRANQSHYITVTASTAEGYNTALVSRRIQGQIDELNRNIPNGYTVEISGEMTEINRMVKDMTLAIILAFVFIYMVMVAQFQSLLSPFIIIFTIPLAFTGGMLGLIAAGEHLSMLSLMGFLILMGTVVNNGIVFVDYANQLRMGGMERRDALVATGKTRMRPILMTAMTTILAMSQLIFGDSMSTQLSRGMAIVIAAGLTYATLMTLIVVPVMYDIFYKKQPMNVELDDDMDDVPDDAAEFIEEIRQKRLAEEIKKLEDEGKL